MTAHAAWHIATTFFNFELNVDLATLRQIGDHVLGVDDLYIVRCLNVSSSDLAFAFFAQAECDFIAVLEFENHALEIQQNIDDVFLHAING